MGLLKNVKYHGVKCSNDTTWTSSHNGIFDLFTITNLTNNLGERLDDEYMLQWTYIPSTGGWQINSEFNSSYSAVREQPKSSALAMLVLDCSSSLEGDFSKIQNAVLSFLDILRKGPESVSYTKPKISATKSANFACGFSTSFIPSKTTKSLNAPIA